MKEKKAEWKIDFIAGGISGCIAKTTVAPLDRVKILMQGQRIEYINLGPFQVIKKIYHKSGVIGLYQGNFIQLMRIFPYSATQYCSFRMYNETLCSFGIQGRLGYENFIAGAFAGITSCVLTYPLDLIRSRVAFQDETLRYAKSKTHNHPIISKFSKKIKVFSQSEFTGPDLQIKPVVNKSQEIHNHNVDTQKHIRKGISGRTVIYQGFFDALTKIYKDQGIKGLYKGITPTIIGMAPYAGFSFYTFKLMQSIFLDNNLLIRQNIATVQEKSLNTVGNLLCGATAGIVAQTISYPLDVVRKIMQITVGKGKYHKMDGRKRTWFSILRKITMKYGVKKGLFRGLTTNYIRVVPVVAISFTTYEYLTRKMKNNA